MIDNFMATFTRPIINCAYVQSSPLYADSAINDVINSGDFSVTGVDIYGQIYTLDISDCVITPEAPYVVGTQTFTASYNGSTTTFTATISDSE